MDRVCALVVFVFAFGCSSDSAPERWGPAFDASGVGWLLSVWGPGEDTVYAVGGVPDEAVVAGEGVIMRRAGDEWERVELGLEAPLLNWMYGFGPNDIFVAGNQGTILHWDGSVWASEPTPTEEQLWGVWGASPGEVWAVGGSGRGDSEPVLLRRREGAWESVALPELDRETRALFKVWGTSRSDVIVVGQRGVVLRYDGNSWRQELVGTGEDLISLWGTGPGRIAIVGGRGNGVLVTWNGTSWHTESLSPLPGLNGVWMRDEDVIHVVGIEGTIASVDFESRAYVEEAQPTRSAFHAVFGDVSGRLTTVGGNLATVSPPYEGIAYTRELASDE